MVTAKRKEFESWTNSTTSFGDLVVVALASGLVGSVVTAFLVPPVQHYFWTRQRHAEICLGLIQELTNLAGKFWVNFDMSWHKPIDKIGRDGLIEMLKFRFALNALGDQIHCLFSAPSWEACEPLFDMVHALLANREEVDAQIEKTDFSRTKERALRALYSELALTGEQSVARRVKRFGNRLKVWRSTRRP